MQAKMEQAWEADKLAKRQTRTPKVAVESAFSAAMARLTSNRKSTMRIWFAFSSHWILSHNYRATCVLLSRPFLGTLKHSLSSLRLETACTGLSSLLAAGTPTPRATDAHDAELQSGKEKGISHEALAVGQGFRAVAGGPARGSARGQEGKYDEVRRASAASLASSNATSIQSTVRVAFKWPQARD